MNNLTIYLIIALSIRECLGHEVCSEIKVNVTCELEIKQKVNIDTLCTGLNGKDKLLLVPTLQLKHVSIGKSVNSHCLGNTKGYLKYVTLGFYNEVIRSKINYTNIDDLVVMKHAEIHNQSEILIEILPIHYLLQDIRRVTPTFSKSDREITLGSIEMYNYGSNKQLLTRVIPVRYERRFKIFFDNFNGISGLSVSFAHQNISDQLIPIKDLIYGHQQMAEQRELYEVSKELPAGISENVVLKGTWTIEEYNISGTLIEFFENDFKEINRNITAKVTDIKITDLKTVWTTQTHQVYPGFRPYFLVACVILFGTVLLVFIDITRQLLSERSKNRNDSQVIDAKNNRSEYLLDPNNIQ